MLPLSGITVLDLSRVLAGPWCTQALSDLGAEVLKVEMPGSGDESRGWGRGLGGRESTYYLSANRNKKGLAIDLSTGEGQQIVRDLARQADVVIQNFKYGTVERFGLDYETLSRDNPGLVYCSISGFGRTGPFRERPGYDMIAQAEAGIMHVNGEAGGEPLKVGFAVIDLMTGMYAGQAILAGLVQAGRTGRGTHVDLALFDCGLSLLSYFATTALLTDEDPVRYGNTHPDVVPYGVYQAGDGPFILAIGNDRQYARMCRDVLDRADLAEDPRFARNQDRARHRDILIPELTRAFSAFDRATLTEKLAGANVPSGEVRTVLEALRSAEAQGRGMVHIRDHPDVGKIGFVGTPFRFDGIDMPKPDLPPTIGQHTDDVLSTKLGLGPDDLARLRRDGIVA